MLNLHEDGLLKIPLSPDCYGLVDGAKLLNTDYIETMLPGIVARFGANRPVTIDIVSRDPPLSYMKPGQIGADVTA